MPDLSRLYTDEWTEDSDDEEMASPFFATPGLVSRMESPGSARSGEKVSLSPITMSAQKMSRAMQVREHVVVKG